MKKSVKLKIWITLGLMVIFFVPFPTAFTETVDPETEPPVKFLPDSSIEIATLEFLVFDKEAELSFHLLPVNPDETKFEIRLVDKETSAVIPLSESGSESNFPCNWEWWMFNTRNCDSTPPETDEEASGETEDTSSNDGDTSNDEAVAAGESGNASRSDSEVSSEEEIEISKFMIASSDYVCLENCRDHTIQSYRKVCVSYDPDPEDSQSLKPHVWFKHGCTNCFPLRKKEDETSSIRVESSLLPLIGAVQTKNSRGWLNGNVRSFGSLNLGKSIHAKPTVEVLVDIDSTGGRYGQVRSSVGNLFEAFESGP
ncbi:MAG: hypothetical protein F4219_07460 [Gammaproteobacteria bacterium]|nr:hypothetical protein [Gammaproteobacteria bacterium]